MKAATDLVGRALERPPEEMAISSLAWALEVRESGWLARATHLGSQLSGPSASGWSHAARRLQSPRSQVRPTPIQRRGVSHHQEHGDQKEAHSGCQLVTLGAQHCRFSLPMDAHSRVAHFERDCPEGRDVRHDFSNPRSTLVEGRSQSPQPQDSKDVLAIEETISTRTVEEQSQASVDTNADSAFDRKSSSSSHISTRSSGQLHVQRPAYKKSETGWVTGRANRRTERTLGEKGSRTIRGSSPGREQPDCVTEANTNLD